MRPFASEEGEGAAWRVSGFRRGIVAAQERRVGQRGLPTVEGGGGEEHALCLSSRLGCSWRQTKHDAAKSQRQGEARLHGGGLLTSMLI